MALRLNGSSSGYVELDVPEDAGSHTLTLPDGGGSSGQYLQTNGSGGLSWAGVTTGKILQVQYAAHKTVSSTSCANNTRVVLTTFGVTITPSSTSSKIIVSMQLSGGWSADNPPHESVCSLSRRIGATDYIFGLDDVSDYTAPSNRNLGLSTAQVALGNNDANLMSYIISNFQDSPSTTSAITYYPVVRQTVGSTQTFYHNRTGESNDDSNHERGTCWMIAMEVAG